MRKRKKPSILRTRRYKLHNEPEKYYHSKLMLYYPWTHEHELINGWNSYKDSYMSKQHIIQQNGQHFNDDCEMFDFSPEELENIVPKSLWDLDAPSIALEDAKTVKEGYNTLQQVTEENVTDTQIKLNTMDGECQNNPLSKLYEKAAKQQDMTFCEYCTQIRSLNTEQCHIVMYNRVWCKSYINAVRHNTNVTGYRIFLSGPGGTGKSHVLQLIKRDMIYFVWNVVNADDDQPIVLMTAPMGSAAFQIDGSTIDSALLLYENGKNKLSWEKKTIMQIKLQHLTLLVTDEISMVGFKKFQDMNQTICTVKGTHDGDWGNICMLAVGDLYQLPPVGQ